MQLEGCTLRNLVPCTLRLAAAGARQVNAQRLGQWMVVTRHQNQQAVPQDTSVLCPAPQVCGQASHCTKEGVTDRRDLITRLVDWPCQTSKPWGKACLSHGAQPTNLATRFPLFVIPSSV